MEWVEGGVRAEPPPCLVTAVTLFRPSGRAGATPRPVTRNLARFGVYPVDPCVTIRLQHHALELGLATAILQ